MASARLRGSLRSPSPATPLLHVVEASDFWLASEERARRRSCPRSALSLVEVLVILGIVGILLSLAFPAVQQVRERARNTQCANNLHQIGIAAQQHASAHGTFPGLR